MPQEIPKLVADVTTDHQLVTGPDGKQYRFNKKFSQDKIDGYFIKKGWVKKDNKWYTASGEEASTLKTAGSGTVPTLHATTGLPGSYKLGMDKPHKGALAFTDFGTAAAPSIFAGVGSLFGGSFGAGVGGAVGEATREMAKRFDYATITEKEPTVRESLFNMGVEGVKQAALDKAGQKAGDVFFKALNKAIPHAVIKGKIPLLPSDVGPNGKIMRYVEDLLSNLSPSSGTMQTFIENQSKAAANKAEVLANSFSKFKGTNEEVGTLVQDTLRKEEARYLNELEKLRKSMPAGKQTMKEVAKTQLAKDYMATFKNELMKKVTSTENPELITGFLRSETKAGLESTRRMMDFLHETKPELVGKIQSRLMRDIINETMQGAKDPTIRRVTDRFSGKSFTHILDDIGQEKLKAIYGETGYNSIKKFEDLVAHVDRTSGAGFGKFLNLIFLLPFRSGVTSKAMSKVALQAIILNRAAKVITSPEGIGIYENYVKASTHNLPRLMEVTRRELVTYNERTDREEEIENQKAEEQFKQMHNQQNKEKK